MYEKRREEVICSKDGKPTIRTARFLTPNAKNFNNLSKFPNKPLVSDIFTYQNHKKWPLNVQFAGWKNPQKKWRNWFNKLLINHATTWIESGIVDGIQATLHEVPCNKELVLGVCEFWCPRTSSFIFPWGEATITLEDVMILGGLPVIGEPLKRPVDGNLVKFEEELKRVKWEIPKGGTHSAWIEYFMEEEEEGEIDHEEGEFEHVAFLSLWLSRFVLPDLNDGVIGDHVFPIAIHLSQGTPIALASVVLANLYHELTLMTQNAMELAPDTKYYASGLFKIVQLWVYERFPELGSNLAKAVRVGDPRVARWDNVVFENWDHFPFYKESEQTISNCAVLDDCSLSFARFLCSCTIYGHTANCRQKYQPHRVAMQFGYDQDIPGEAMVSAADWDKGGVYIPARTFDPGVSRSYYNWWKDSMLRREEAVDEYWRKKRGKRNGESLVERQERGRLSPGGIKSKGSYDSKRLMLETCVNETSRKHCYIDLDHVPLALRLRSNKRASCNEMTIGQTTDAVKSPQMKFTAGSPDPNGGKGHLPCCDSVDIDHIPLALRIGSIARSKEPLNPLESYASTEEFASRGSDADSQITRKSSTLGKTDREVEDNAVGMSPSEILARVAQLERAVAALGAAKSNEE
ncbi:hypothetical protein SOVF_146810 [Spinacia oleracea]|nr:hypothetical protein SOVF_146810 [Spinacia oleracea]